MRLRILPWLSLYAASPVLAAEGTAARPSTVPGMDTLASTFLGLAFILILIFVMAWVFKRIGHLPMAGKGLVRVVGGTSLGARERVVVVEVEDARLVLGVSPGRIQTLHVLPAQPAFEQSLQTAREDDQ